MIDFRYHLVSIVSVFLALAVGVIVGSTALNGAVVGDLRDQVKGLKADKRDLQAQQHRLQTQVGNGNQFAAEVGPAALDGQLAGTKVLIVEGPGADAASTAAVRTMITSAGGTVSTEMAVAADYVDPRHADELQQYAASGIAPAGLQLPTSDDAGVVAGSLLADVLMSTEKGRNPTATERQTVLAGFRSQALLRLTAAEPLPATAAVVMVGTPPAGANPTAQTRTLTDLALALQRRGKAVVIAGPATSDDEHGAVSAVRQSSSLSAALSTVDNVDTAAGQVAAVLALTERGTGRSGQYGVQSDAEAPAPAQAR